MGARKLETWPIFILHKILMVSLADPGRRRAERLLKGQWRREGAGAGARGDAGGSAPWAGWGRGPRPGGGGSPARGSLVPRPCWARCPRCGFRGEKPAGRRRPSSASLRKERGQGAARGQSRGLGAGASERGGERGEDATCRTAGETGRWAGPAWLSPCASAGKLVPRCPGRPSPFSSRGRGGASKARGASSFPFPHDQTAAPPPWAPAGTLAEQS